MFNSGHESKGKRADQLSKTCWVFSYQRSLQCYTSGLEGQEEAPAAQWHSESLRCVGDPLHGEFTKLIAHCLVKSERNSHFALKRHTIKKPLSDCSLPACLGKCSMVSNSFRIWTLRSHQLVYCLLFFFSVLFPQLLNGFTLFSPHWSVPLLQIASAFTLCMCISKAPGECMFANGVFLQFLRRRPL